jgi:DNA-binding GntR family transcriptional regulator
MPSGRGPIAVPVPPGVAEDVFDARGPVEGAAVERLLREPARSPAALITLREDLEVQRPTADLGDLGSFARFDGIHRR